MKMSFKSKSDFAKREEWHKLLMNLKTTVEGLLSMPCSDVWNIYGGLDRLSGNLEQIMCHSLKVTIPKNKHGNPRDFWEFAKGLRWLNPVMAPSIERYSKISPDSKGKVWIRQSLLDHNLSSQLLILTEPGHLQQFYHEDAFLCQSDYFKCLIICLQAVEENRPGLLADINPYSLSKTLNQRDQYELTSTDPDFTNSPHAISSVVPIDDMVRRTTPHDHLAPPMLRNMGGSPKTNSVLLLSDEHAVISPSSYGSSSDDSAKEALLQLLSKSGDAVNDESPSFYSSVQNDPLMNVEISAPLHHILPTRPSFDNLTNLSTFDKRIRRSKKKSRKKIDIITQEKLYREENIAKTSQVLDSILNNDELSVISDNAKNGTMVNSKSVNDVDGLESCDITSRASHTTGENIKELVSSTSIDSGYSTIKLEHKSYNNNNKGDLNDVKGTTTCSSNEQVIQNDTKPKSKKSTHSHHRSMSDFGIPDRRAFHDIDGAYNEDYLRASKVSTSVPRSNSVSHDTSVKRNSFFHQPAQGESLIGFLSSQDFHTCADLDKENAHFSICETLISAIEKMKWNQVINPSVNDDNIEGDSDEEIQKLKQRIRIRRRDIMKERAMEFRAFHDNNVTESYTTTSMNTDSQSDFSVSQESSGSSDEVHDADINEADKGLSKESNLRSLKESGLSLSLASLYSEQEIHKSNLSMERSIERKSSMTDSFQHGMSAESVAIALLKRFSEKQLPKASELEWLVSEQDAPQRLLPLPDSYPVSPDDNENSDLLHSGKRPRLRGNLEWAPPRAQIIFNIHPQPKKKVILAKQNYRCAGCGTKVDKALMKSYHYCEYLGKYFCPCCHSRDLAYIPGYILRKWDFTKYNVSHFARNLLKKIFQEPLYSIAHINPGLYRKVKVLDQIKDYRSQLMHLLAFLKTCRLGQSVLENISSCPSHWTSDIHMYSLEELVQVKHGELVNVFKQLVSQAVDHISQCPLCQAKGFICELCNNDRDIIYPFELGRVVQCDYCSACFHKNCFVPDKCPKCIRIENRRQHQQDQGTAEPT